MELIILLVVIIAIIGFIIRIITGIIYRARRNASFRRMNNYIMQELNRIDISQNIICLDDTGYFNKALVIDNSLKKLCILVQENKRISEKIYSFSEFVSSQISENGTTVTETSLDNALVGGLLFGKTGAIVGALSGDKSTSNMVTELSLNLVFNDKTNPFYKFIFASSPKGMSKIDKVYIKGWNEINKWHNIFCLIIEENKKKREVYKHNEIRSSANKGHNVNVTDELFKLSELKEKGILTQAEFEIQKKRLLKNSTENM